MRGIKVLSILMTAAIVANVPALHTGMTFLAAQNGSAPVDENFDDGGTGGFGAYTETGDFEVCNENGELVAVIYSGGSLRYANQLYRDGVSLEYGSTYRISFDISSEVERELEARIQMNGGDYRAYFSREMTAGPAVTHVEEEFTMTEPSDASARLCWNLGSWYDGEADPGTYRVKIDNVKLTALNGSADVASVQYENTALPAETDKVAVNQVGYLPGQEKDAVVADESGGGRFEVVEVSSGEVRYTGELTAASYDPATERNVCTGDFTAFNEPGTYVIIAETKAGKRASAAFEIGDKVYTEIAASTLGMLTLARCGAEVTDPDGTFSHPACHTGRTLVYGTNQEIDVTGGWHDAGDYGRYVVSGVKTVADLFLAYKASGSWKYLDEAKFELDWLMKMQDPVSGGVYHKVSCLDFPDFVMPQDETGTLYAAPVSTAATGDFAAVMAKASVLYKYQYPAFAASALEAAKKAYAFIKDRDDNAGYTNPADILTGEYPDTHTRDEIFWAEAELYLAGVTELEGRVREDWQKWGTDQIRTGLGWDDMGTYAIYDLAAGAPQLTDARRVLLEEAEKTRMRCEADGYHMGLGTDYVWGSNMLVADNGMLFMMAAELTTDAGSREMYRRAAAQQLSYLLGTNGMGYCYVSGFGTKTVEHSLHRPSQMMGTEQKGMLAGGPNSHLQDPTAQAYCADSAPALCYVDHQDSWTTNEVTVYWNSPLICLLAQLTKK